MKKKTRKNMFPIFLLPFVHFTDQNRLGLKNTKTVISLQLKLLYEQNSIEIRSIILEIHFITLGISITLCW